MLREAAALQTANGSVSDRTAFRAGAVVSWRALVAAAVLSLVIGAALFQGVAGERSSVAATVRPGGFSHKGLISLPLAAQGPVSAAMGADSPAYRVSATGGGFAAASPAQRLSSSFGRSGVSVSSGSTHVGLSLQAVGYGSSLAALGEVAPRVKNNRVVYARAGLSEWYVNGPLGLEQGFTISTALAGHPAGPLTLSMALSGNARASLASGGQGITLSRAGRVALRYSGLSVTDAHGRLLHGWLELQNGRLLLRVDTRDARYPLRIDPFVQQGEKLTGGGEIGDGNFGVSVALSSDGNTALIGGDEDDGEAHGAAWVFTRSGPTWTQQAKLTCAGSVGYSTQCGSVALSSDGNTALVGGGGDNEFVGAVWVFTRSGSTWTQQGEKLTASGESGDGSFGNSVALSSDGNTALIGGYTDNKNHGAAWVFTRSGTTWTQQTELTGGGESGSAQFGATVALSAEGTTALIGGPGDKEGAGAAWVFTRSGETWTQQGEKLTGRGEIGNPGFGVSVALSAEGTTALIGGWYDNNGGNYLGAAWVFTRSGEIWTQQGEKLKEVGAGYFGISVSLSANGNTALIGAPLDSGHVGEAWVFMRSEGVWTQQGEKLTGAGEMREGQFGIRVVLSADGTTALIGSSGYAGPDVGAAWVFVSGLTVTNVNPHAGPQAGGTHATITGTGFGGATAVHFGTAEASQVQVDSASEVTAVSPPGTGTVDVTVTTPEGTSPTGSADHFTYQAAPTVITGAASSLGQASATLNATVNPEDVTVSDCHFDYGTSPSYGSSAPCSSLPGSGGSPVPVSASVTGLSPNTAYYFRIVATNALGTSYGSEQTFNTLLPNPPVVATGAASSVAQTTATLNATVNPEGATVSDCHFEYGTSPSYGSSVPCTSLPGSGTSPVSMSASVTSLSPHTTYSFRIVASNLSGTSYGSEQTFTTLAYPPTVVTGEASSVMPTSATLNATVNPEGVTVSDCHFEYGTSLSYGSSVPCTSLSGSGETPVAVSASVGSLSESITYHFRIAATNSAGTSYGGDQTFTPLADPPEFGRCIKVQPAKVGSKTIYHGGFAAATCLVASGTHTGKYEWYPGVVKTSFTTKLASKGSVTFESAVTTWKMTCTGETSAGEYTGLRTVGGVVLTLTGCKRGTEKYSSIGAAPEEIVTNPLEGVLGVVELGATSANDEIGLDLYPVGKTGPLMEFSCGLTTVSIQGSVIVPVKTNKMSLTQALKFKASKGKQTPEGFVGEPKDILEASFNGAPYEQTGLTLTTTQTNEEAVEVNSVV